MPADHGAGDVTQCHRLLLIASHFMLFISISLIRLILLAQPSDCMYCRRIVKWLARCDRTGLSSRIWHTQRSKASLRLVYQQRRRYLQQPCPTENLSRDSCRSRPSLPPLNERCCTHGRRSCSFLPWEEPHLIVRSPEGRPNSPSLYTRGDTPSAPPFRGRSSPLSRALVLPLHLHHIHHLRRRGAVVLPRQKTRLAPAVALVRALGQGWAAIRRQRWGWCAAKGRARRLGWSGSRACVGGCSEEAWGSWGCPRGESRRDAIIDGHAVHWLIARSRWKDTVLVPILYVDLTKGG